MKYDVKNGKPFLNRDGYTDVDANNRNFSGFAGGQFDWQFTTSGQTKFSTHQGEVWADMFLG